MVTGQQRTYNEWVLEPTKSRVTHVFKNPVDRVDGYSMVLDDNLILLRRGVRCRLDDKGLGLSYLQPRCSIRGHVEIQLKRRREGGESKDILIPFFCPKSWDLWGNRRKTLGNSLARGNALEKIGKAMGEARHVILYS